MGTEASLSNYVHPICMWQLNSVAISSVTGKTGFVVGWGLTENDTLSTTLRQAILPVVSLTTCLNSNRDFFGLFLSDTSFCAGFKNGKKIKYFSFINY